MAIVRILVDGYSLLHGWRELAPGKPRFSAAARDDLIHHLTLYRDAIGTPITLVFDGAGPVPDASQLPSTPEMEIIYSRAGQTADQLIERVAALMQPHGEVLVVTDDYAERDMVTAMGGTFASCFNFIHDVQDRLQEFNQQVKHFNARERNRFHQKK